VAVGDESYGEKELEYFGSNLTEAALTGKRDAVLPREIIFYTPEERINTEEATASSIF